VKTLCSTALIVAFAACSCGGTHAVSPTLGGPCGVNITKTTSELRGPARAAIKLSAEALTIRTLGQSAAQWQRETDNLLNTVAKKRACAGAAFTDAQLRSAAHNLRGVCDPCAHAIHARREQLAAIP
jgi:hypothetical protein